MSQPNRPYTLQSRAYILFFFRRATTVLVAFAVLSLRALFNWTRGRLSVQGRERARVANARLLRRTLESLGATLIKFGQILATRPDYLPEEYIRELERLLDRVAPFPTETAIKVVEQELGADPREFFAVFPGKLVASASFGQVYDAELHGGKRVAVKVQRPNMDKLVRADLRLLKALTHFIDATTLFATIRLKPIFTDFESWTWQELDYRLEARFANRLYINSAESPIEKIPMAYWELTSRRVLVLEFLDGLWVKDVLIALNQKNDSLIAEWEASGIDLNVVARNILKVLLQEGFREGIFHADPHPSNIVILDGNCIGLVDFGIVGYVGRELRINLLRLLQELSAGHPTGAFRELLRIAPPPGSANLRAFRAEYQAHVDSWADAVADPHASLAEKSAARLLFGNLNSMRRYGLHLPNVLIRYYRALIIVDSIILRLDPEMDVATELRDFLHQLVTQDILATLTEGNYYRTVLSYQSIFLNLPTIISELLDVRVLTEVLDSGARLGAGFLDVGRRLERAKEVGFRSLGAVAFVALLVVILLRIRGTMEYRLLDKFSLSWNIIGLFLLLCSIVFRWLARRIRVRA